MLSAGAYSFRQKSRLAISLSWVAGYTNVITFVMLGSIVVSHVTGNVTHFGLAVGEAIEMQPGAWRQVLFFGHLVLWFFLGAISSAVMTEIARRRGVRSKYMLPMAVEALLLTALALGVALHMGGMMSAGNVANHYWMSGVATMAMGLQNATITRISGAVVRTTHLTGVVTDFGLEGVQYALWAWDRSRLPNANCRLPIESTGNVPADQSAIGNRQSTTRTRWVRVWKVSRRQPSFQRLLLLASIFGSFLFGAVAGTFAFSKLPAYALVAPVAFLLWIVWVDWRKPIADVRELDLTADTEFGGHEGMLAMLPEQVGLYRLTHHRRDALHHAPDFQAWIDRLPEHWRVIILAVSPLTYFDTESALNLTSAVERLRRDRRDLIMCGVKPNQFKALSGGGLVGVLGTENFAPDIEFAVARALNVLMENAIGLRGERDGDMADGPGHG
jgi:uncharacterized membrane protein YoaK (UPF0700 family)